MLPTPKNDPNFSLKVIAIIIALILFFCIHVKKMDKNLRFRGGEGRETSQIVPPFL